MSPSSINLVGTTIDGKYRIDAIAGVGGAATVFRATHVTWGRPVAVKVIKNLGATNEEARAEILGKLVTEAKLLASLSEQSAAIVQAYDVGTLTTPSGEWAPYLVLSWLSGATLEDVLAKEEAAGTPTRTLMEAVALLTPAANALALAHTRGIAHRDIKPSNLFVTGDPRGVDASIKVLDFGIAKVVADAKTREGFNATLAELTSFTPAYGAPEQFSKALGATGPWTDVYGLSLVLLEVASGQCVTTGDDLGQLAYTATRGSVRPTPRRLGLVVSDEVEAVMAKAVAVRPEQRFADVGAFWSALSAALCIEALAPPPSLSRMSVVAAPPSSRARPSRTIEIAATVSEHELATLDTTARNRTTARKRTSARWKVLAAVLVGFVAAGGGYAVHRSERRASPVPPPTAAVDAAAPAPVVPACPTGMITIPAGKFFMGSDDPDALPTEKPQHKVSLHVYCMDRTEVTMSAYKACSDAGGCNRAGIANTWPGITAKDKENYDPLCNAQEPEKRGEHPVNCVDHAQAANYCREQGKRLPTEAEWEYAARGPDGRRYPWGDSPPSPDRMNACGSECAKWGKSVHLELPAMFTGDDGWVHTAPVGSFPAGASRYGLVDVVGNVWEWVSDGFGPYANTEATDPSGSADATTRVIRGGAWNGSEASWVRPTFRYGSAPAIRSHGIGFRCAADLR